MVDERILATGMNILATIMSRVVLARRKFTIENRGGDVIVDATRYAMRGSIVEAER